MAIEAPISKFKKNNVKIGIVILLVLASWFAYDGHFNDDFIKKNTVDGVPNDTLVFNQKAPPYLAAAAVLLGIYLAVIRNKKLVADENELVVSDGKKIAYDSIEKIDKTHFESKGYFIITYSSATGKDQAGSETKLKISDRKYDNLAAVLDELVAKIS